MADYRNDQNDTVVVKRGGGTTIAIILAAVVVIVGLLFATGFWSADVTKSGALPEVAVKGGALPQVDLNSKELVVGTSKTKVAVPKVETTTATVDVPTVGVKDDNK